MPELPEVETVVRGLRKQLPGRTIISVHLGKTDFMENPADIGEMTPGRRIAAVERIGKFIRIPLEPGGGGKNADLQENLIVHLGMTGRLTVRAPHDPVIPHTHVFFQLDDGNELRYTDVRRFGQMMLLPAERLATLHEKLGADPLDISADEFCSRLGKRNARIKALLLDQSVLRGVGNIYADESLWRARIHPARIGASLNKAELLRLRQALQSILHKAIDQRGSSISSFLDAEGKPGGYQKWHRAYQRTGHPCPRCGTVIERAIFAGRSSHFCPHCQPPPHVRRSRALRAARKQRARRS